MFLCNKNQSAYSFGNNEKCLIYLLTFNGFRKQNRKQTVDLFRNKRNTYVYIAQSK